MISDLEGEFATLWHFGRVFFSSKWLYYFQILIESQLNEETYIPLRDTYQGSVSKLTTLPLKIYFLAFDIQMRSSEFVKGDPTPPQGYFPYTPNSFSHLL